MKTRSVIQPQDTTTRKLLSSVVEISKCDYIGLASAFCTVGGIRKVESLILNAKHRQVVVGLDDYITHPSAIRILQNYGCTVRVAGARYTDNYFHPKIFFLGSKSARKQNTLVVGSANLTVSGLSKNVEAITILESEDSKEKRTLLRTWQQTWAIGRDLDLELLNKYEKDFNRNRKALPRRPSCAKHNVLESDDAIMDPCCASSCWIEVGKITGFQAEQLEIKAEQALFFDLPSHGGPDTDVTVKLSNGSHVVIPAKYRKNAMWRFNLPDSIPEVHAGLRPKGGRSPYIAIFTKHENTVTLKFIKNDSSRFRKLKEKSKAQGTLGKTTTRLYGWF